LLIFLSYFDQFVFSRICFLNDDILAFPSWYYLLHPLLSVLEHHSSLFLTRQPYREVSAVSCCKRSSCQWRVRVLATFLWWTWWSPSHSGRIRRSSSPKESCNDNSSNRISTGKRCCYHWLEIWNIISDIRVSLTGWESTLIIMKTCSRERKIK